jgi:hypothetical protein
MAARRPARPYYECLQDRFQHGPGDERFLGVGLLGRAGFRMPLRPYSSSR